MNNKDNLVGQLTTNVPPSEGLQLYRVNSGININRGTNIPLSEASRDHNGVNDMDAILLKKVFTVSMSSIDTPYT